MGEVSWQGVGWLRKWIIGAVVAGMLAATGAAVHPQVLWSAPAAAILGHKAGTAFGVQCRIGSRPYIPSGVCLVDTGDLSGGLLIAKGDASWWHVKVTGKTQIEGVTGIAWVLTGMTTLAIGPHVIKVNVVIDPHYHGYPVIGPSLLARLGATMTVNFQTGGVEFHGAPS